jgi:hypothetical protein
LPQGKSAVDVFADFLKYLNQCARNYITETHIAGKSLLASGKVEYILSHPNAWEGPQQALMRNAAVQAGLIKNTGSDRDRISFISEGEASLNFCLEKALTNDLIRVRFYCSVSGSSAADLGFDSAGKASPSLTLAGAHWTLVHMHKEAFPKMILEKLQRLNVSRDVVPLR